MGWQKCSAIRSSYLRLFLAQSRLSVLVVYYQGMSAQLWAKLSQLILVSSS